jgi:hypothetical protein
VVTVDGGDALCLPCNRDIRQEFFLSGCTAYTPDVKPHHRRSRLVIHVGVAGFAWLHSWLFWMPHVPVESASAL